MVYSNNESQNSLMGSTVDAPCGMKSEAVTESGRSVEGDEGSFSPEVDWNNGWENEAREDDKWEVMSEN